jgi:hypothetical protein
MTQALYVHMNNKKKDVTVIWPVITFSWENNFVPRIQYLMKDDS